MHENDRVERFNGNGVRLGLWQNHNVFEEVGCVVNVMGLFDKNEDYEELEAEKAASARKRSRRIAEVQEESMANASKMAEIKAKELDEKMKSKYGQWVKTDFEP